MSEFNQDPTKLDIIKDGEYLFLDNDGESFIRQNYKDGKPNGLSYYRYVSGELWVEENYINGVLNGTRTYYSNDGVMSFHRYKTIKHYIVDNFLL